MPSTTEIDPGKEPIASSRLPVGATSARSLIENVAAMYGLWAATILTGVALLPFLTRRLGPIALGKLSVSQSLGWVIAIMAEYGFNFYAAREVSVLIGQDVRKAATFAASIIGAKALLLAVLVPAFWWLSVITPALKSDIRLTSATALWIVGFGSSPIWLFQGLGRIKTFTAYDVACKIVAMAAVFATVRRPGDAWLVQLCLGLGLLVSTALTFKCLSRDIVLPRPTLRGSVVQLRLGWTSFTYRLSGAISGQVNPFLMSLSTTEFNIGLYALAEKVARLSINALQPLSEAIYPFVLHAPNNDKNQFPARFFIGLNAAVGLVCCLVLLSIARPIVAVMGGGRFPAAAGSLRLLALSVPLVALNQALALFELVRKNRTTAFAIFTAISLGTQFLFGLRMSAAEGHTGMAKAVLITQATSTLALVTIVAIDRHIGIRAEQYRV